MDKPLQSPSFVERRINRLTLPECGECRSMDTRVVSRTEYVLYIRCSACAHLWSVPKPGAQPLGN